jgi:RNA polymerase sigma-70 factor (ECF subfamily)
MMDLFADEEDAFAGLEVREELMSAIYSLSPELRQTFILLEYKGFSVEEAADILKIQPGTVKSRNHRAKSKLKKFLEAGTFLPRPSC